MDQLDYIASRPHTSEKVLERKIAYEPKKDPEDSRKFLRAPGPLVQLYIRNQDIGKEETLEDSNEHCFSFQCSAKGTYFAALTSCCEQYSENILKVWNLNTRKIILQTYATSLACKISPQEKYIAFETENSANFVVYALANGKPVYLLKKQKPHREEYLHVPFPQNQFAFSPDDQFIVIGENSATQIVDLENLQEAPAIVEGHTPRFEGDIFVDQDKCRKYFLITTKNKKFKVYDLDHSVNDLQSGKKSFKLIGGHAH